MKPIILFFKTPKKVSSRPVRKMVLFFKAQQFKNQPGYVLQNQRWHSMLPEGQGGEGGEQFVKPSRRETDEHTRRQQLTLSRLQR